MSRFICDWALHPFYSDILVSNTGIIMSYKRGYWYELKQSDNGCGYLRVGVGHENPQYVHLLVAQTFLIRPIDTEEVDHINEDKYDNRVSNLEWVTTLENNRRAWASGLKQPTPGRAVRVIETGIVYKSLAECAREIDGIQGNVAHCLLGNRRSHRGFTFEYADGELND
jgi:hypothetical protein